MASVPKNATITEYSNFIDTVYGLPNDRYYSVWEMLVNIQRFSMRGIKGVRKDSKEKVKTNILIAFSWYFSLMNRLHINVEEIVWNRFPYVCSYCGKNPCECSTTKVTKRQPIVRNDSLKPRTISGFQKMFNEIYPPEKRTPQDAAIHLAEETGELAEAFHIYGGARDETELRDIELESADFFSCIMGVANSFGINMADELSTMFSNNCHVCKNAPCTCDFKSVNGFKS